MEIQEVLPEVMKFKYLYNGKELQDELGLNVYDYGARTYHPAVPRFWQVDPLAHLREWVSPFNYVQNNPINRVDPTGALDDWVESADGEIYWDENATSQETTKEGEKYLGKAVVVFNGSENEKMGTYTGNSHNDKGKDVSLLGQGAILAKVTVYGPDKKISNFEGYTMTSDPSKFGVVADGDYTVNRLAQNERKCPYGSDWVLENRTAKIPAKDAVNPAYPNRNPGYLKGVFIHRPNNDGWAGTFQKNGKTHGVSEGCLLIKPTQWSVFNSTLKTVNSYHLILNR